MPLPGSMPSVDTQAEARELVATQDENPLIDLEHMDMPMVASAVDSTAGRGEAEKVPATV
jgi:MHS family proline/betaine transporter-like MFS transporter